MKDLVPAPSRSAPTRPTAQPLTALEAELLEALKEMKELFRFALLSTSPAIARDAMPFIRKAEAAIAKATADKPTTSDESGTGRLGKQKRKSQHHDH